MARARKGATVTDMATPDVPPKPAEPVADQPDAAEPMPETEPVGMVDEAPEPVAEEPVAAIAQAEPAGEKAPRPEPPARRRGGFVGTVLGGAIAAGLGFGAAGYLLPRLSTPAVSVEDVEAVKVSISDQAARLDAVGRTVEEIRADTSLASAQTTLSGDVDAKLTEFRGLLSEIDTRVSDLSERLAAYEDRVAALEKRPVDGGAASATALEAFGRDMEAFREEMAAQRAAIADAQKQVESSASVATESIDAATAEAERIRSEAERSTRQATMRAALTRIEAALASGGALGPALADLDAAGVDVPAALADQAQGVPTMQALQETFAPAARSALAVSLRETADGTAWDRVAAFLRVQSGARSLVPKSGGDPDAVLSRAEAALAAGDLAAATGEIAALPAAGQARMAEWVELADRRIAATEAVKAMTAALE